MEAVTGSQPYSKAHFHYDRIQSREVRIGHVPLGGSNPIRIQSMTTKFTMDTLATVEETLRLVEAGCEYVRITAPSQKEAHNLAEIKKELKKRGCEVPLIADIHYTPNAAEVAARIVEKVRVNPGNYADKKRFQNLEYTDQSYQEEIERIAGRFSPLVKICKEYGTAMRIGTNHGSLSDRILSRYGDTPHGMVESALEFVRICEDLNYYDIVISMKASNPQVMVQAYRLLMQKMLANGQVYPTHLGVTEAGEGEDGRIKSALGIATLLMDGIGDTVRVSLTEDPEFEPPVANFLVDKIVKAESKPVTGSEHIPFPFDPYSFKRRKSTALLNIGGENVPRIVCDIRHTPSQTDLHQIGYEYVPALDKYNFADQAADFVFLGDQIPPYELPGGLSAVLDVDTWQHLRENGKYFPLFSSFEALEDAPFQSEILNFLTVRPEDLPAILNQLSKDAPVGFVLDSSADLPTYEWRKMIYELAGSGFTQPIILKLARPGAFSYYDDSDLPARLQIGEEAKTQIDLASNVSTLLVDGLVDGLWIEKSDKVLVGAAFGALQLSRLRITKTEYISCPSCGRTLFDLQETTARIRARTEHLKGVKIGIMGCIVNGPGEMADADYGYVGTGPGKITLYRGQEVVQKSVPTAKAVDSLIDLIRQDGNWVDV